MDLSAPRSGRIYVYDSTTRMPYAAQCRTTVNATGTFLKANPQRTAHCV